MKKFYTLMVVLLLVSFEAAGQQSFVKMSRPKAFKIVTTAASGQVDFGYCPGAFYSAAEGVANYYAILTSVPSNYNSNDGSVVMESAGWALMLDLYGEASSPIAVPAGVYRASEDSEICTYYPEYTFAAYQDENGNIQNYPVVSDIVVTYLETGEVQMETEVNVDGKNVRMVFTGVIEFANTNEESGVLPEFHEDLNLNVSGTFAWYYGNLYQNNTGNMLVNLYEGDYDKETGGHTGVGYCLQLCLFDVLFTDPKSAKVMPGTYKMARSLERDTWFPGVVVDYMGVTMIMGTFCQKHDKEGNYSYAYVSDGTVVIENAENGQLKFTVDLVTESGHTIKASYVGTVPVTDMSDDKRGAIISTLQEDYQLNLDGIDVARVWKMDNINGCGRFYMDIGSPSGMDEYVEKNGGDIFRIDMLTEPDAPMFDSGVYTVMEDKYDQYYKPFRLRRGFFEDGGDLRGTRWFHFEEGRYMVADGLAPAYAGEVSVKRQPDGNYQVDIDVFDDGGFNITGSWNGPIKCMFDVPAGISESLAEAEFTFVDEETLLLGNVGATDVIGVYAVNGQKVRSFVGTGTISLNGLPQGIYVVKATGKKNFKVIKR